MEENNITTKNISGFVEFILVAIGLLLFLAVPYIYSLRPPANSPIIQDTSSASGTSSFTLADN